MDKANKSFLRISAFSLLLTISIAGSTAAHKRSSPASAANTVTRQVGGSYTIKEAGLQFDVPKGWKVEKQDNGNVVLSVEDGAITITFMVEDKYEAVAIGMKGGLKEKVPDLKSDGDPKQDTHNGMVHFAEAGTGSIENAAVIWRIDVLKATKNVTILTFGIEKVMEAHGDDYGAFVQSLKKI